MKERNTEKGRAKERERDRKIDIKKSFAKYNTEIR